MKQTFLKWLLIASLVVLGIIIIVTLGAYTHLYTTFLGNTIGVLILAILAFFTMRCGYLSFRTDKAIEDEDVNKLQDISHSQESGWFAGNVCTQLGLIGTVVGFMFVARGFGEIDTGNLANNIQLIAHMMIGVGIALVTTLIGQVSKLILNLQYFNLEQTLRPWINIELEQDPTEELADETQTN